MIRLAEVMQRFLPVHDSFYPRSTAQYKACNQIQACRTRALGGFQLRCDACHYEYYLYHACRNRHCPRCQYRASEQWEQLQLSQVVDAPYFHLVFTLPHELNGWARLHPRILYRCLFRAAWETLNKLGQDGKRLNGQIGMSAVLHTWGQNLDQHIHLHCLVPGGALSKTGEWHPAKSTYLFPVKVLSRLFRGKMVSALRKAEKSGELVRITAADEINRTLDTLMKKDWVVYARHALKQPASIVKYLSRYTRKIALSESRIVSMDDDTVRFRYKDYRDSKQKIMPLAGEEFLRRFLQHVLPDGFMRIRHYGWLANACRRKKLIRIKAAIAVRKGQTTQKDKAPESSLASGEFQGIPCKKCKAGLMVIVSRLEPLVGMGMP